MSYATTPTERTPESAVQGGCKSPSATRVYVRVRPFSHGELHEATGPPPHTVKVGPQAGHITILDPENNYKPRMTYSFEHCFDSAAAAAAGDGSDQEVVYQHVGKPVLHNVIDGYNGCIFAYGQTGSGKTYTMLGPPNLTAPPTAQEGERNLMCVTTPRVSTCKWSHCTSPLTTETSSKLFESQSMSSTMGNTECQQFGGKDDGLIPRLASDIFDALRMKHKNNSTHSFRVEIEYYEIYNEKVFDLMISGSMNNRPELRLRYQPTCGAYVDGLVRKHVKEEKELLRWILRGSAERHVASTKMNERSSRSHAILVVHIVQMTLDENDNGSRVNSKLNLVDLAGSERTGASGVEGKLFKEATKINLSLTALGRVIDALADLSAGKHGIFCPYRDSKLTWLLMDSLGGNSKTSMVATISPHCVNFEEMCQTLRYASRAKQIINKAVINEDPQVRQIKTLTAEVARLQHLLRERPRFDYKNEDVQRLQERVRQLEQDIVERDLTIDELRSQLLENNTETQKLADENNNLRRDAQEVKRLKVKVTRLQSELRAENEETEKLRQRLEAFKEEKEAHIKSALIIPSQPSNKETLGKGGKCNDVRLQLGYATAEGLNRLGIKAEDGNYERLIDAVTRYALDAKGNYEAMLQRNTMMIDSHSHALRESLKQMEGKEWAILTAAGEKLIASFEKAASKQNPTTPTSTSGVDIQETKTPGRVSNEPAAKNAAEKLIVQYKDQIRRTQRELANVSALLRESKEHVRKGKENAGKLQGNNDLLQRQVDKLMNERDELKKNCEQQKKETEMLQTRENDVKKKLTATETILQEVENNMELLRQNNLEIFKAVVLLLEEELSAHHFLLIMEANERHSLLCRHHESLLHYDRQLAEDKMEEMRKEHNMTAEESAALARSLKEEIDVLNTANSQQEKHFKEFMSRISLAFHSHSDVWCASLHGKSQHLMEFYKHHTAVLQEKENEIQNKLMLLKQNADTREEEAHFVLEKEMAKSAKTLLQKEEELNQMKELYTTSMQNQRTAQQLEMKMVCQSMEQYIKTVTQQMHDVLQLNKHREDMVIQVLRNMYETSIQQLMEQMEHKEEIMRQLEDEFNTTKRQQLQDAEVQKEQLHNEIADMQSLMEQLKNDALETQNQLHDTYNKKEKMLKDIITSTETSRDDALQKITEGSRLIQAAGHLMKENTLLYQEYTDNLLATVSSAMGDLRTEHTTHVMEMERTHTARLDELQREHEQRVRGLEKTADMAKAVLSQHRKVAEREALAMREAHNEQISSLARESCTIVAEHAAGRQSIAHEEGTARVDMAVALRHLTLQSLQRDEMSRELVDGHAAFLEHCVAEHAAWVEETCEVLASVDAAVKRRTEKWMESERTTSLIVSKQQECAQQLHESHVHMLLGELDSVQEWMGALSVAVSSAMGDLRTEHTTHVMEMERTHTARLDELQREHEQRVRGLEKTADMAKAVLSQHRKVAEREALAMREAHNEQISSLARESCTIVAEHAAGRQSIAHEEGTARVDMAVALRHLTLQSLQRDEMSRELVDGHAAFLEHCVAEHAAWVEETCEVLASVDAAVKRRTEKWMESERTTSLIVSKQQECAQQLHESHVHMLLGELDSVQEWMGALSVAVSSAMGDLRTEHTTHVMEMERTHTARLDELQREHEQRVRGLEKTADMAKAVLSQHRKVAEREALAMREAHNEQISSLARESCTIVAEHAAGRQSIAHEEGTARVDMAVALRHLTLQSLQRDEMSRELVDGHAAFLEHCVAEHAAWVEETCEVLASVDAAVKRRTEKWMESERTTSLIVSKQQECAQQLHESHVHMLLGELDSVQEWMGALSVAVSSAMGDLRTEHTTHVMEMERTHTARLDELQREHEQRVRGLEKTADMAKAVLSQHRKVAEREALAMREAHNEQISSLARESCTIVAEHAAGRQSIAHEEGTARVDMAVALRHLTLQSLQRDEMSRELVDGHAAFLEHCVAEHAAWVEETCEVLASVDATTNRHAKECHELRFSACMKLMDKERAMLMAWEAGESLKLQAWAEMLLSFAQESGVLVSQVDVATKAVMFESDAAASCEVSSTLNFALVMMMLLEQYKQRAFEEFTIHLTHLADARQMCSVSVATEFVKQEDEMMITALEDHLHQEILLLKKENIELKTNLGNLRADLEFQANLDKLEEEIVLRNGQQDNQRHGDSVLSGVYGGNEKGTMAKHHSNTNTGLGSYISSFFQRSATVGSYASPASGNIKTFSALKEDCDDRGTFASVRKPPPQSGVSSIPFTSPHPSLAARSKSKLNQVQIVNKKLSRTDGLSHTTEKSKKRESSV